MKQKTRFSALAVGAVAMGLLLGASIASAATVRFDDGGTKATGIDDLNIGGTVYDVTFNSQTTAFGLYGPFPGSFFFNTADDALASINAIVAALNASPATSVGEAGLGIEAPTVNVGYGSETDPFLETELVLTARGVCGDQCVE